LIVLARCSPISSTVPEGNKFEWPGVQTFGKRPTGTPTLKGSNMTNFTNTAPSSIEMRTSGGRRVFNATLVGLMIESAFFSLMHIDSWGIGLGPISFIWVRGFAWMFHLPAYLFALIIFQIFPLNGTAYETLLFAGQSIIWSILTFITLTPFRNVGQSLKAQGRATAQD